MITLRENPDRDAEAALPHEKSGKAANQDDFESAAQKCFLDEFVGDRTFASRGNELGVFRKHSLGVAGGGLDP